MTKSLITVVPGAELPWALVDAFLYKEGLLPPSMTLSSSIISASGSDYSAALCASTSEKNCREIFGNIAKALAPGSRFYVYEDKLNAERAEEIKKDLLLSGFTESKAEKHVGQLLLTAIKPSWLGAKASLKPKASSATPAPESVTSAPKTWALNPAEDNDELMDDEELLTEEDKRPVERIALDDCDVGKSGKKACKNCTCGRAEMEEQAVKLTPEMLENPQSACGSCGLGDAFRCASCPYKGLPAFEMGQKVQLRADFLTADV
ncbi:hypothetical protein CEUSTIGMA_g13011.t1 [Chlamydomonas eustigma]|uniref:Anamorsin homolog n=1 Tax=Chlamydomonas eustigma TaxID=1157962 RepID=A0A250XRC9_9CHLO|nr:hypothetical protein CEUSTIGMA_g13011.t1 [Chlamydomonas eustigma]|eukprot:GAX85596.1 hypothetical protein CEUSTIGMA_g13011.t1 [Chlamydomonas eustigma]